MTKGKKAVFLTSKLLLMNKLLVILIDLNLKVIRAKTTLKATRLCSLDLDATVLALFSQPDWSNPVQVFVSSGEQHFVFGTRYLFV